MKIEEIENLMNKFYDLDSDVDDKVFEELRNFANRDKEGFIKYANSQKLGPNSYRPIIYESIMDEANGWEGFLLEQIEYIIQKAETGNKDAIFEISSIYYLTNISGLDSSFYKSAINFFKLKLDSSITEVKKSALEYIVDLHSDGKIQVIGELKNKLQKQLKDKSYKVRLYAYLNLRDSNLLPIDFKQTMMDKIRTKMSPDYRNYLKAKEIGLKAAEKVMKNNL